MVEINWNTGIMKVDTDKFFPAKVKDLKILLNAVRLCNDQEDIINQILKILNDQVDKAERDRMAFEVRYPVDKQIAADCKNRIESLKHSNGLPLTEEELKDYKALYKTAKRSASKYKKAAEKCKQTKKRLIRNIEQVEDEENR